MSAAEDALAFQLRAINVPFEREVQFAKPRRWRADFQVAAPADQCVRCNHIGPHGSDLLIEIDGGTWTGGRHVTGRGHAADAEKRNAAVLLGYRPLTFTPAEVESGQALKTIEAALGVQP